LSFNRKIGPLAGIHLSPDGRIVSVAEWAANQREWLATDEDRDFEESWGQFTLRDLDAIGKNSASENFGIRYTSFGDDWIEATIPLDERTRNANGALHAGALGILAETMGSAVASLCIDTSRQICLGQILNINHPVSITSGPILARASPVSILPETHVWNVEMKDPNGATVSVARLTMVVLERSDQ
jgi:1,4-dihydroxy-2-naphthoyl-CoA hydrolase